MVILIQPLPVIQHRHQQENDRGMNPPNFKVANESASDPVLNRMVGTLMEAVLKSWLSFSMKVCSPSESAMVFNFHTCCAYCEKTEHHGHKLDNI